MVLFYILFILSINQAGPTLMEVGPKSFLEPDKYVVQPNDRVLVIIKGTTSMEFGLKSFLDPNTYIVQPNDRVLVIIKGKTSYSFQTFVTPDGKLPLSRINLMSESVKMREGIVDVKGKTLLEVKEIIKDFYTKIYGDVDIELALLEGRKTSYSFQTFVTPDGKLPLYRINLLSESVKMVEGIVDVKGKTLLEVKEIMKDFYTKIYGDVDIELTLVEGGKTYIYVEGEVNFPGAFSYYPGMSIDDYIGLAGGFTESARKNKVYVVRNGEKIKNIGGLTLMKGDKIVVPKNWSRENRTFIITAAGVIMNVVNSILLWKSITTPSTTPH